MPRNTLSPRIFPNLHVAEFGSVFEQIVRVHRRKQVGADDFSGGNAEQRLNPRVRERDDSVGICDDGGIQRIIVKCTVAPLTGVERILGSTLLADVFDRALVVENFAICITNDMRVFRNPNALARFVAITLGYETCDVAIQLEPIPKLSTACGIDIPLRFRCVDRFEHGCLV